MAETKQVNRWRCTVVGCNPVLMGQKAADDHASFGHRVAKWPIRSAAGKAKARERNRTGYYDQYNVGEKSAVARGIGTLDRESYGFGFSPDFEDDDLECGDHQ